MDRRAPYAREVLDSMAMLTEHVVGADYHELLGQAISSAGYLPANALHAQNGDGHRDLHTSLVYVSGLLLRALIEIDELDEDLSVDQLLAVVDRLPYGMSSLPEEDPLWGWVAAVMVKCNQMAATPERIALGLVTTDALRHCLSFMAALDE